MAGNYQRGEQDAASGADPELLKYQQWFRPDLVKAQKWRKEAKEDFKFRDGDQWSDDDKRVLEEQGRYPFTFNRTGVLVDAVVGAESSNRREVRYIPRETGDSLPNELLTSAAEWFRDQCNAEDEESTAFKDVVTSGMGWTETRLDRTNNPAGDPKIEQISPFEMVWHCDAMKPNLTDAKRLWRVRKVDTEEAEKQFPGFEPSELNAAWADEDSTDAEATVNDPTARYTVDGKDRKPKKVTIVACQYVEEETYYKTAMLQPGMMQPTVVDLDEKKHKIAQKAGVVLQSAKMKRETVMQCILGSKVLVKPTPTQTGGFSWICMTGLKDNDNGIFYGIVRRAKDPQRWANKWLSQIVHILNSQAKGGVMMERGAAEDDREFEASWARSDRISYLEKGTLSNPNGAKIQPKPVAQFPAGFDRLLQYADDMIIKATGINMELLGMREVNQPGVLEYQRKQSGMGILASFFDSLKRYRKIQGKGMLRLIQDYLSDGRMVRIVGQDRAQYVPLTKPENADIEYDIIVDDAPTSPNEKERTFQLLTNLLPMFKDAIGPQEIALIAEYSPLPASFVEKLKQGMAQKAAQPPQPDPAVQAQMQTEALKQQSEQAKYQVEMEKIQLQREEMAQQQQQNVHDYQMALVQQEIEKIKASAAIAQATRPQPISPPSSSRMN
jgi:hypothetical protein